MAKKIVILTIFIVAIVALTSCTGTLDIDEVVVLKSEQLVNPNGYGSCWWLSQQDNNCTLTKGEVTIIDINQNDPRYVLAQQGECQGWIVYSVFSKKK